MKLDAPVNVVLPDLAGLAGVASADPCVEHTLEAVHWDTPDLRLARARITLCQRTGATDTGWQLTVPVSGDEWIDLRAPLGDDADVVPADLLAAVTARARQATIAPAVQVHMVRKMRSLRDAQGRVLLEIADDALTARRPGGEVVDSWREWDAALVHGDRDLLARTLTRLKANGGTEPPSTAILARAGGNPRSTAVVEVSGSQLDPRCAGAAARDQLRSGRDGLLARDPRVRRDQPGAAHRMLEEVRRMRAALATFRPLMVREPSDRMRAELAWLATMLEADHNAQAARSQLVELVEQEPDDLVVGPVAVRLDTTLAAERTLAHEQLLEALDSDRYYRLLDELDELVATPKLTKTATKRAARVLPDLVRHDWSRLAKTFDAASSSAAPGADRDRLLHEAHKACARVRYAADAVAPTVGAPADKFARAAKHLQMLLARHDDLVAFGTVAQRVGAEAAAAGENAFTYGRLHAIERTRAAQVESQLPTAWDKVRAPRRHRWMN